MPHQMSAALSVRNKGSSSGANTMAPGGDGHIRTAAARAAAFRPTAAVKARTRQGSPRASGRKPRQGSQAASSVRVSAPTDSLSDLQQNLKPSWAASVRTKVGIASFFVVENSMSSETAIRVLTAGAGVKIKAMSPDTLVRLTAAKFAGVTLEIKESLSPDSVARVAAAGRGHVLFDTTD
jgi:hypothetical protein